VMPVGGEARVRNRGSSRCEPATANGHRPPAAGRDKPSDIYAAPIQAGLSGGRDAWDDPKARLPGAACVPAEIYRPARRGAGRCRQDWALRKIYSAKCSQIEDP